MQTAKLLRERLPATPQPDLLSLLDLVALATVCDVVPLTGINRAFVVKGLQVVRRQANPGLAALARAARIGEPVGTFHLAFLIGPRINAGGASAMPRSAAACWPPTIPPRPRRSPPRWTG